jgi:hypothetical protein
MDNGDKIAKIATLIATWLSYASVATVLAVIVGVIVSVMNGALSWEALLVTWVVVFSMLGFLESKWHLGRIG